MTFVLVNQEGQKALSLNITEWVSLHLINSQRVAVMIVQLASACLVIRVEPGSSSVSLNTKLDTCNTNFKGRIILQGCRKPLCFHTCPIITQKHQPGCTFNVKCWSTTVVRGSTHTHLSTQHRFQCHTHTHAHARTHAHTWLFGLWCQRLGCRSFPY